MANWRMSIRPKLLRAPVSMGVKVLTWVVELIGGIHLPYTVKLGRRVRIWHHGGIVLHARSIGDDVHIRHCTTFGIANRDQLRAIPIIEDRVDIGCGACILGNVTVGHDSLIGANAVVISDIPPAPRPSASRLASSSEPVPTRRVPERSPGRSGPISSEGQERQDIIDYNERIFCNPVTLIYRWCSMTHDSYERSGLAIESETIPRSP